MGIEHNSIDHSAHHMPSRRERLRAFMRLKSQRRYLIGGIAALGVSTAVYVVERRRINLRAHSRHQVPAFFVFKDGKQVRTRARDYKYNVVHGHVSLCVSAVLSYPYTSTYSTRTRTCTLATYESR